MQTSSKKQCKLVRTPAELKKAIENGHHEFAIILNYGLKSCKRIYLSRAKHKKLIIENCIDNSKQTLTDTEIIDDNITNIGKAMRQNAFFVDE